MKSLSGFAAGFILLTGFSQYQFDNVLTNDYILNSQVMSYSDEKVLFDTKVLENDMKISVNPLFDNNILEFDYNKSVIPSPVIAEINTNTTLYKSLSLYSGVYGEAIKGEKVEILKDRQEEWYLVRLMDSGIEGYVLRAVLDIPDDVKSNKTLLTQEELELYINSCGYESKTTWLVFTDIGRQMTYVFSGKVGEWKLDKSFVCSTGKNASPTTRGLFKVTDKGSWFYAERLNSGAKYWTRFNGAYLFHSVAMDRDGNITDDILGERRSSGCVRLSVEDAKWIFDNIKYGTTVFVY